ncbi:hypothetical protein [Nocardia sp. NPDC049149]|uniref:hypothetical protein n=1 Tax=Nocardia sp. NPDC049149 TaxID=3364315 RepID=UPI00370FE2EB
MPWVPVNPVWRLVAGVMRDEIPRLHTGIDCTEPACVAAEPRGALPPSPRGALRNPHAALPPSPHGAPRNPHEHCRSG